MRFTTVRYKARRAWSYFRSGFLSAVREFFRRRRLVRLGAEPEFSRSKPYPRWPIPHPVDQVDVHVALIAAESLEMALAFEWHQTALRKDSWQIQLDTQIDLLLVSTSAQSLPIWDQLPKILSQCAQTDIPRILWIDEPHSDVPQDVLEQFDLVAVTHAEDRATVADALGPSHVVELPAAIQPMIHNPRALSAKGKLLPRKSSTSIRVVEALPYREVLSAYRAHSAFHDPSWNSVALPSTRTHMEILACGGWLTNDRAALPKESSNLIDIPWQSHVETQEFWLSATYRHRVNELLTHLGKQDRAHPHVSITPLVATIRPGQLPHILDYLAAQRGVEIQPMISTHGFEASARDRRAARELGLDVTWLSHDKDVSLGQMYNVMLEQADFPLVAKMDDDDFYDSTYLLDSAMAMRYSNAGIVGKRATFVYLESLDATYFCFGADENRFVHEVAGPTLVCSTELALATGFSDLSRGEDSDFLKRAAASGASIYAGSRFGFVRMRSGASHTWNVDDSVFTANGEEVHSGGPTRLELPGRHGLIPSTQD